MTRNTTDFVMFDIGSGDGSRAIQWLQQDRSLHVFCFDPMQSAASAKAQEKTINGRMHFFGVAVTANAHTDNAKATLYCMNDKSSSSLLPLTTNRKDIKRWLYPPGKMLFKTVDICQVPVIRMDKFMADRRLKRVLFVRIETQGSSLDVLKSFGDRIKDVLEFAVKVHTTNFEVYHGQTTKQDLVDYMRYRQFSIYGAPITTSRGQEEIVYFINQRYAHSKGNIGAFRHVDYNESDEKEFRKSIKAFPEYQPRPRPRPMQ